MPLCVKCGFGVVLWTRGIVPCIGAGVGRSVGVGSGSDLSEAPVFQGVSRSRWSQSRPWVFSRARQSF
jgi:hypothetical protein